MDVKQTKSGENDNKNVHQRQQLIHNRRIGKDDALTKELEIVFPKLRRIENHDHGGIKKDFFFLDNVFRPFFVSRKNSETEKCVDERIFDPVE